MYTHFYEHALNLACSHSVKGCKLVKDTLDIVYEDHKNLHNEILLFKPSSKKFHQPHQESESSVLLGGP